MISQPLEIKKALIVAEELDLDLVEVSFHKKNSTKLFNLLHYCSQWVEHCSLNQLYLKYY